MSNTRLHHRIAALLFTLALAGAVTLLSPPDAALGGRVRLVYFHGAWVWTGKVAFALSGFAGLAGLILWLARRAGGFPRSAVNWSRAFAWTALAFWLTYLPMSLVVQVQSWGGISWDEPRWRLPLALGVAAVLLQIALALFRSDALTCLTNLIFGIALWILLGGTQNVLHPESPIFTSGSARIIFFFAALFGLCLLTMLQMAWLIKERCIRNAG